MKHKEDKSLNKSPKRSIIRRRVIPAVGLVGIGAILSNLAVVGGLLTGAYNFVSRSPMTGTIEVSIVDATRKPFDPGKKILLTVIDGNQKQVMRRFVSGSTVTIESLKFHDNFGDNYIVIVWSDGFKQAGLHPVKLIRNETVSVNLMLIPNKHKFNFHYAQWETIKTTAPSFRAFVSGAHNDADARERYEQLMKDEPLVMAHVLNTMSILKGNVLPSGETVFSFYRELVFDERLKSNKFYSWVDRGLVAELRSAVGQGSFEYAVGSDVFHQGNTASFKEVNYSEANVQITFFENTSRIVNGVEQVLVETDIDYYRDPLSHILLEVIPNTISGSMTNPVEVYQLRWIAVSNNPGPVFNPLYVIEPVR